MAGSRKVASNAPPEIPADFFAQAAQSAIDPGDYDAGPMKTGGIGDTDIMVEIVRCYQDCSSEFERIIYYRLAEGVACNDPHLQGAEQSMTIINLSGAVETREMCVPNVLVANVRWWPI